MTTESPRSYRRIDVSEDYSDGRSLGWISIFGVDLSH